MPDLSVSEYKRNQQRMNELIAYAKPYRLSIQTTSQVAHGRLNIQTTSQVAHGGVYQLTIEHPQCLGRIEKDISRALVDGHLDPPMVLKGYIDEMKKEMQRKYPDRVDMMHQGIISELRKFADPFELTVISGGWDVSMMEEAVQLSIKHPDYGFKAATFRFKEEQRIHILSFTIKEIHNMKRELGWPSGDQLKKDIEELRAAKPFVLECPVHGGVMVPGEEADLFVCLVPSCTKKARRKYKHHVSGTVHE
jgi:hypothetical protein